MPGENARRRERVAQKKFEQMISSRAGLARMREELLHESLAWFLYKSTVLIFRYFIIETKLFAQAARR